MEKCVIIGNGYKIRSSVKSELAVTFDCCEDDVEYIIDDEYSKVYLVSDEILSSIDGNTTITSEINPGYYDIFDHDHPIAISNTIVLNQKTYNVKVFQRSYGENNSKKTIEIELSYEDDFIEFDDDFYNIKVSIKNCILKYYNEVYFNEDTQNANECMKLYGMIYKNENKLRSIINKYMIIKYGINWFQNIVDESYKVSVKNLNLWYFKQPEAEFKNVRCELYNLLIDELIEMLKDSQIEGINSSDRKKYNEFYDSLKNNSKLKQLLQSIEINKESIWEKNFIQFFDKSFEDKWSEYRYMRNMVAHNKLICKSIISKIAKYSIEINEELISIEERLNTRYQDNEKVCIKKMYAEMYDDLYIEEAGGSLPSKDDVLWEINESEEYRNIVCRADSELSSICSIGENISSYLEEILDYLNNSSYKINKSEVIALYKVLSVLDIKDAEFNLKCITALNSNELLVQFMGKAIKELEHFYKCIENTSYNICNSFQIGELICYCGLCGNIILSSNGYIMPSLGSEDIIELSIYKNSICIDTGRIEKRYFDYSIDDEQGYAMPDQEESLDMYIDELYNTLVEELDQELTVLNKIEQILTESFTDQVF